uniref:Uncharacterized protein n=1 Tax=Hydrodictyon reticulatum TaxID=3107 RepID=A0A1W5RMW6_HYDRE|nr:hypothetical protein [Hydrodictyon reticulatum]AQU64549.1 hypothetical protein [Hydrodictyon reticulatum]
MLLRFSAASLASSLRLWLRRSRCQCLRFSAKPNRFSASASVEPMPPLLRIGSADDEGRRKSEAKEKLTASSSVLLTMFSVGKRSNHSFAQQLLNLHIASEKEERKWSVSLCFLRFFALSLLLRFLAIRLCRTEPLLCFSAIRLCRTEPLLCFSTLPNHFSAFRLCRSGRKEGRKKEKRRSGE